MISCLPIPDSATMEISGTTPNGSSVTSRLQDGKAPWVLRGGTQVITTGGLLLDDTEAPMGVPLKYETRINGISAADRLIQNNLMLTPHFNLGVFGWLTGTGRTLSLVADGTAHQPQVAQAGSVTPVAPTAPPVLIGHAESAMGISGSYVLSPSTTTNAVANGDWVIMIHVQLSSVAITAAPAGWTEISTGNVGASGYRRSIWKRKRQAGDGGTTIAAPVGASAHGTVFWVRGMIDEILVGTPTGRTVTTDPITGLTATTELIGQPYSVIRPNLVVATATEAHTGTLAVPTAGSVTSGTFLYTMGTTSGPTTTVATQSNVNAGDIAGTDFTYLGDLLGGSAVQIAFQSTNDLLIRTIARGKAAALTGPVTDPFLFTGRLRYVTTGLRTWQDAVTTGTWQANKTATPTWLGMRGSQSAQVGDFAKVFLTIVNPADNTDYIPPVQIIGATETLTNTWIDFSAYISPTTTIPTTAEIRLVHGSASKEYSINWYLDEFGITPGAQRVAHSTLYWFSGSSTPPANAVEFLPGPGWVATTTDAAISWTGTAGNSTSQFLGPSGVVGTTQCQLDPPADEDLPCEPVFLSDPVNVGLGIWVGLIKLGDPTHPGTRALYRAINRAPAIAVSQARAWEDSQLVVLTSTLAEREFFISVMASGRTVLMRNPEPLYPENNWYISIPDINEERIFEDQRRPERLWSFPYTRVERPTGLIEATTAATWQNTKDIGTWLQVRAARGPWLNVLTGDNA